ncbi:MAG: DUF401 family protein, partial [Dehalococcoidales bacterium]|nr:DUF401 family protein [Dehalococcoidales bacterium]
MLNPSIALLISIVSILILIRIRLHASFSIFIGSLIVAILVLPMHSIPSTMLDSLFNYNTIRLMVIVASALTLSHLMGEKGLLAKLANTLESISPKFALHFIPAVIGLIPMPAGALISATASRDLVQRTGLNPEQGTFINYWFRHIWEFSIPVYPSIIITSVVLSIPLFSVVKILSPMTALAIILGAITSYWILRKIPNIKGKPTKNIALNLLKAAWPILLLAPFVLIGLEAMIAFPLILVLLILQQRAKLPELKTSFKYGLDPKIIFLLYAIMFFKITIESSGTADILISDMQSIGFPSMVILIALPMLMGLATGLAMTFAGVALPLLLPYIASGLDINSYSLLLVYVSGLMGVLLSPVHLCLILSAEYFKANLIKVYCY